MVESWWNRTMKGGRNPIQVGKEIFLPSYRQVGYPGLEPVGN